MIVQKYKLQLYKNSSKFQASLYFFHNWTAIILRKFKAIIQFWWPHCASPSRNQATKHIAVLYTGAYYLVIGFCGYIFVLILNPNFFSLQNRQQRWPLQLRWTKLNKIQIVMERAALTWLSKLHWRNWILMSFVFCVEAILSIQRQWSNVCIHVSNHYWWPKSIGF